MSSSKIDHLRELLSSVGKQQHAYWKFFIPFSARLEKELGEYLGDPSCVSRSCAERNFTFAQGSYMESGLGFKNGKFVIPLMFRLRNLEDEGECLIRVFPLFTLEDERLTVEFEGQTLMTTSAKNIEPLLEYIYQHLTSFCGKSTWFAENPSHYQSTAIGFTWPNTI